MLFSKTVTSSNGEALVPPRNLMTALQESVNDLEFAASAGQTWVAGPAGQTMNRDACPGAAGAGAVRGRRGLFEALGARVYLRTAVAPIALAITLCAGLIASAPAGAAGLGRLSVHSELGQPLNADVDVPAVGRDEAPSLQVRLASQAAFKQANLEFNPALTQLRFDLQARPDGSYAVHVTSAQAINEPYLDLLLELTWSSGRVLREYTVLLDPPGMRQAPEIIAPAASPAVAPVADASVAPSTVAPTAAPAAAPAAAPTVAQPAAPPPVAAQPAPAPAAAPAPAPAPAAETPTLAPTPAPQPVAQRAAPRAPAPAIHVSSGDTLGRIALDNKPRGVSLDQMLVALLHANSGAFINGNMNLLKAGKDISVPASEAVQALDQGEARREVVAQSADFAAYRSRLAQSTAATPPITEKQPIAAGQGRVTAKVEDKSAAQKSGDQLKINKADAKTGGAAAAGLSKKDEEVARKRALKESQERAAALAKANDDLRKANDLAAAKAAAAQKQAEAAARDAAAKDAAAKAAAAKDAAAKEAIAKAEAAKAEAARAEAAKAAEVARVAAARVEAAKAEVARAEAAKADAGKAAVGKTTAPGAVGPAVQAPAPVPASAPAPAASGGGLTDMLTSPLVLGGAGGGLLLILIVLNILRRRRGGSDQFRADGDNLAANSLFGTAGGQSVDTGATSTFNSSFIPAASQLDSNEVDPVAEADVYVAYGREEQAEDILKEALRVQPDRHPVRIKLLEIYSRRGDTASFNAVAQELHNRTGGMGEDWDRAAKLGKALDPNNPLYAGAVAEAPGAPGMAGPSTDMRFGALTVPVTEPLNGPTVVTSGEPDFHLGTSAADDKGKGQSYDAALSPETLMPVDSDHAGGDEGAKTQVDFRPEVKFEKMTDARFDARLPPDVKAPVAPPAPVQAPPPAARPVAPAIDFGALDFDLGPSKLTIDTPTELPIDKEAEAAKAASQAVSAAMLEPPTIPSLDLMFPPTQAGTRPAPPTVSGSVPIPNIDLNLPASTPARREAPPAMGSLEEALSRPTLVGAVGALDGDGGRLSPNTDQATVPLIDFDLTGADAALTGRRTETQAGSPMASQMATKLDLARGYIDLGVKDGARELLEEVMKDGTRDQRQQAVELIKLVEV
jgi:pilus assembly protein FimV